MEGITDLHLVGVDENRPPKIQKAPYIDLIFKLNHKAIPPWCKMFNDLVSKASYPIKIKSDQGLFVETWVRTPEEIEVAFKIIKQAVSDCSVQYVEMIKAQTEKSSNSGLSDETEGEQGVLNRIIAGLDFSPPEEAK